MVVEGPYHQVVGHHHFAVVELAKTKDRQLEFASLSFFPFLADGMRGNALAITHKRDVRSKRNVWLNEYIHSLNTEYGNSG